MVASREYTDRSVDRNVSGVNGGAVEMMDSLEGWVVFVVDLFPVLMEG